MRVVKSVLFALSLAVVSAGMTACAANDDGTGDDPVVDAGASGPDSGSSGGSLGFMEECNIDDDQCSDGLHCFNYNRKGPHCTHECSMDNECEEPSTGCNNKGVCKAP